MFAFWLEIYGSFRLSGDDSDELSDREINKLLIVTQSSSRPVKHEGYDRTGDWTTRVKMSQEIEQAINDGLYYYEEDLWDDDYVSWISCNSDFLLQFWHWSLVTNFISSIGWQQIGHRHTMLKF